MIIFHFIVATFNRKEKLSSFIDNILEINKSFQITCTIVDSGSTDGTLQLIDDYKYNSNNIIDCISLSSDVYWSEAMKKGIDYRLNLIESDDYNKNFIILANDDIELIIDNVKNFFKYVSVSDNVKACVGSIVNSLTGELTYGGRRRAGLIKHKFKLVEYFEKDLIETFNCNFVLLRSDVLNLVGGFRRFKHAFADYDLGFRINKKGIKIDIYELPIAQNLNSQLEEDRKKKSRSYKMRLFLNDRKKFYFSHYSFFTATIITYLPIIKHKLFR